MENREMMYDELLEGHWLRRYSWRGLQMESLVKRYRLPRVDILAVLREIAHTHPKHLSLIHI